MKNLTFRLVAVTEAAGKYKPGAVRDGNEDALYADIDLSGTANASTVPDSNVSPGAAGALFVVADGMGGMNAGEVASQIAIDSVRAAFQTQYLTEQILSSAQSRAQYMEDTIRKANDNIIREAASNPERSGMGSTLIMAWLMPNGELTVSWIGDSRAYVFNKKIGIHSLSEDHSLVQQLVRNGLITYEQSFDHPQNNVILRSLGDASQTCQPETRQYHVGKGDILLLCSDGLSGVLRDRPGKDPATGQPYPEENIQDIMAAYSDSMTECKNTLWRAAERGGWYDNVTTILCNIVDGPASKVAAEVSRYEKDLAASISDAKGKNGNASGNHSSKKWIYIAILAILVIAAVASFFLMPKEDKTPSASSKAPQTEAVSSEDVTEEQKKQSPSIPQPGQPVSPGREDTQSKRAQQPGQQPGSSAQGNKVTDAKEAVKAISGKTEQNTDGNGVLKSDDSRNVKPEKNSSDGSSMKEDKVGNTSPEPS